MHFVLLIIVTPLENLKSHHMLLCFCHQLALLLSAVFLFAGPKNTTAFKQEVASSKAGFC